MKKLTVVIDDLISEKEFYEIGKAIKKFQGVTDVYNAQGNSDPGHSSDSFSSTNFEDTQQHATSDVDSANDQNSHKSRQAIDFAIKWALSKGLIKADQLTSMTPESLVAYALRIIDKLPEEEKKKLGSQMGGSQ